MASEILSMAVKLFNFIKEQKELAENVEYQFNVLKINLSGVIEGLQSYVSLSLDGKGQTVCCLREQMENAQELVDSIASTQKSIFYYCVVISKGKKQIRSLKETNILLTRSKKALFDQVRLANKGFVRSQNISLEKLNAEINGLLKDSDSARIFWRDYVLEKSYNIPASKCANYFEAFVIYHNTKHPDQKLNIDRIDLIFQQLFDQDGDGKISLNEIALFFHEIWDKRSIREEINKLNMDQKFDEQQYQLLGQLCEETNNKAIIRIFKMDYFNSNQFLSIDEKTFITLYKHEIDIKVLSALYQRKLEYLDQKKFYEKLEDSCLDVYKKALKVANQVMQAKTSGLLKLIEKDGAKYWIEDTEGGNGMCYLIKGDYLYLSYRNNWLCYSEPTKVINLKTHVTVFSLMNQVCSWDQGYMMHRFKSGTVFYCCSGHDAIRDCKFQIVKSIRDQETFMGLQYLDPKTNKYAKEGEFLFTKNNMVQYKDYYKKGEKVDWGTFKKIGIEHQLNCKELRSLQLSINNK